MQKTGIKSGSRAGFLKQGTRLQHGARQIPGDDGVAIELKKVKRYLVRTFNPRSIR
jgi:hypothetical protein